VFSEKAGSLDLMFLGLMFFMAALTGLPSWFKPISPFVKKLLIEYHQVMLFFAFLNQVIAPK